MNEVQVFDDLKVKEENGQVLFDAESAAIGIGLTQEKNNLIYVRWERVNKLLVNSPRVGKGDFITESQLYKLAIKAESAQAEKFQDWVTSEVLPAIRHTGGYGINQSNMNDVLVQAISSMNERLHALENVTITSSQEKALNNIKRQRVIWVIGGTYRYKQLSRMVSKAILRDLFITYGISRLDDLKSKYFDDAYEFIKNWEPDDSIDKKTGYTVFKRIRESYGSFNQWS